jgi:2-keto-4-pentenoate hydratase/2-oxohepta-3-ene-1,7-dioic acid hydratase in catechol pathway
MQLPRPSKIVCVGLNYVDHANEVALELPERPLLFAKWPNALIGDGDEIVIPKGINKVDYEAELAVIIGRQTRSVGAAEALDSIAAYTCLNDVSARDEQFADGQWTRGKSFDTFCPIGPRIVPAGEIEEPSALRIRCRVNGETVQDATIGDMIFGVAELIAYISNGITLEPGDIVATGTPPGVALGRPDGRYLADADTVEVEIDGIGILTNRVRAE